MNTFNILKNNTLYFLLFFFLFLLCLLIGSVMCEKNQSNKRIMVTAHRGASGLAPENTMASIVTAMELGADYSEIDVQETADGTMVLLHDDDLDRTTDGTGNIWEMSYAALEDVDAGSWFSQEYEGEPIPTLEAIIDTVFGRMKLNIELKNNDHGEYLTESVVALIEHKNFISQCIVTSFDFEIVNKVKQLNREIKAGYIFSKMPKDEDVFNANVELLSVNKKLVDEAFVNKAHANNKEVHVWTVNEPEEMRRLIALGVDNIMTNYPNVLLEILKEK